MGNEEKILLTSLYNNINSYSEITGVLQNLSKGFEDYFGCEINGGISVSEWKYIIDYNTYCISWHREALLDMFYHLSKGVFKTKQCIGVDKEKVLSILDSVETFLANIVELFKREIQLEISSFTNKNIGITNSLITEINDFFRVDIENNIPYITLRISEIKHEAEKLLSEELNTYDMNLWNMKKSINNIFRERSILGETVFLEKTLLEKEEFIDNVDSLKSKIEWIIKEDFFDLVIELLRENIKEKILGKIVELKSTLNGYMARRIDYEEQNKFMAPRYKDMKYKSVDLEIYNICSELFLIEYEYLKIMVGLSKSGFYAIKDEVNFAMNSIFINEFYGPIYYINTNDEFESICVLLEEKVHYMIYNFVAESLKTVRSKYYDSMVGILLRKKRHLDKIYIFRAIDNCKGYVSAYNPEFIIEVHNKINESYKGYKDKYVTDEYLSTVLDQEDVDNYITKNFFIENLNEGNEDENIFNINSYNNIESLNGKKNKLYENINTFKNNVLGKLEEEFISYFDYMFHSIERNIGYAKEQYKYYLEKNNF